MFTVEGYAGGVSYRAVISSGAAASMPDVAGCAAGTPNVIAFLTGMQGQPWSATPTGPHGILDLDDPESVLGALYAHTQVTSVTGDAPDLTGPVLPDVVY